MQSVFSRILVVTIAGFALVGLITVYAKQSHAHSKSTELTGVISDSMCGAKHMMAGADAKCTRTCVQGGADYVLLVGDKVYSMVGKSAEFEKLAGQQATVTGNIHDSTIQVDSIVGTNAARSAQTAADSKKQSATTTIEGLVRDVACPIQNKEATARTFNLKCAQDCARLGSPLIVLTDDGTLYTPISESMPDQEQRDRLMPFLGKYVRITGQVFERNGTRAIAMRAIEEVKGVQLTTTAE